MEGTSIDRLLFILSRDDKLTILVNLEVENEQNTFSGHNTAWSELVEVVLEGRKGLLDYTDAELDDYVREFLSEADDEEFKTRDELLIWSRKLAAVGVVRSANRSWDPVPVEEQQTWKDFCKRQ